MFGRSLRPLRRTVLAATAIGLSGLTLQKSVPALAEKPRKPQQSVDIRRLNEMAQLDLSPKIFHFYDSANPLHDEFNNLCFQSVAQFKETNPNVQVVSIDLAEIRSKEAADFIEQATGKSLEKL